MSRRARIFRNIGIGLAAFVVVLVVAAIVVVRTDWFRNYVREKIVTATEDATGGTVTVGGFSFEWSHLRAIVTDFVIHGNEPAGSAPFVRAARVEVDLRLFTSLKHLLDVAYLGVEQPQTNIMVFPNGQTNIPSPKQKKPESNTTTLETVVDLAVGHFALTNGLAVLNDQKTAFNLRGEDLQAQLYYNVLTQGYQGQIGLSPLYVVSGRNTPVKIAITLPVVMQRDSIKFSNAKIDTGLSHLVVNGSIDNMRDPKTNARLNGQLALADLEKVANVPLALSASGVPTVIATDMNVTADQKTIQVTGARLGLGHSNIEASGVLKDVSGNGALQFKTQLALGELGRLFKVAQRPDGILQANGTAKLDANYDYQVSGNVTGHDLSFTQGTDRIRNVNLTSALYADPKRIDLKGLRLSAFGGEFAGDVGVANMETFQVAGKLEHLDIQNAAHAFSMQQMPYDGVVSGPIEAHGNLKAKGTTGIEAKARLAVAPGRRGMPVSGKLNVDYNGASDNVVVTDSYLALPHSRINLSGSIGNRLNISLNTRDLNDFLAAIPAASRPDISLTRGTASFTGSLSGKLSSPHIAGHLAATNISVEGRTFNSLAADLNAASNGASIQNGSLTRGTMQASFAGSVGLKNWKAPSYEPVRLNASIRNGDLADIMALAGQKNSDVSGALTADATVTGTIGNPQGTADLTVVNGSAYGEPFDRLQARVNLSDQLVTIPSAFVTAGPSRIDLNATFHHPRDSFSTGTLAAHVASNQITLENLPALQKQRPGLGGTVQVNADIAGNVNKVGDKSEFLLTSVNGDASAHGLKADGQNYGDFNATARTTGNDVRYQVASDFAGSTIRANGDTQLVRGYPTNATASIANLPIERVLAVAQKSDIPAKGNFSGNVTFHGTADNPQGSADFNITNAVIYQEPLDTVRGQITYLGDSVQIPDLRIAEKGSTIDLSATFNHPKGDFQDGHLVFKVNSSRIQLAQIQNVQKFRPGLAGVLQIAANGDATVQQKSPRLLFSTLDADVSATGLQADKKDFGDMKLTAHTTGQTLHFALDSDFAKASIHGQGTSVLRGDYPTNAQLAFSNLTWSGVQSFLGSQNGSNPANVDAVADGRVTVSGPATDPNRLQGTAEISKLRMTTIPTPGSRQREIALQNQGPIVVALNNSTVKINSFHITGPSTDIAATGTVGLKGNAALNVDVNANTNLSLLQDFDRQIFSSGNIVVTAAVRGSLSDPMVNGRAELKDASVNLIDLPNGISNANGVILFNGKNATIQSFTGESGGGKVTMAGFVSYGGKTIRLGLKATARGVRVRYQGVSVVFNSNIDLTGTRQNSLASGNVIIQRLGFSPQNDFGSLLSRAAPPVQSPSVTPGPLQNMHLDIRIRTSPAVAIQTSLAQNIEANADMRLRGTAAEPGMLGRVNITSGNLVFFGTKYNVNQGTVAFYNPARIQPILNVSLETTAKGVDVVLTVTGPIDNMKLTYTSDPPLQFQEIVELLAAGRTPTSDPTLLANQPAAPPQTFQQMGESAIVGQAIANPISSQLERVFGVTQLKIDPTFTSGSELPQARVTLQQQVASNLTFTYVSDLQNTNQQIIRVEWAMNPQWSAVAQRDEWGRFSIDFFYKKQFR